MREPLLSSTTLAELSNRPPSIPLVAIAVPGYPIPIIGTTVIMPVVWPDTEPSILPPNVGYLSTFGGQTPLNMDAMSTFGGIKPVVTITSAGGRKYLDGVPVRSEVAEVRVNWFVRVKSGHWHREGRCPVLDAVESHLRRQAPIAVVTSTPIAIRATGIYNVLVTAADWWPLAPGCKPCPAGPGGVPYQRIRQATSRLLGLPDEAYIAIAKSTGIIRCWLLSGDDR